MITVLQKDRSALPEIAIKFKELGFKIMATEGTHEFLAKQGIETERALKLHEGRPNVVDAIKNGEIQLVINTPSGKLSKHDDSYLRKAAVKYRVPYITTPAAAIAAVRGIEAYRRDHWLVKPLQDYHLDIDGQEGNGRQ